MRTTKGGGVPTIVRCAPTFFAATMLIQKDKKMTAVQVNAQNIKLLQGIGAIADSEPLMNRLAKYVERLVREKNRATALTKEQFYDRIERAEAAYRRGESVRCH